MIHPTMIYKLGGAFVIDGNNFELKTIDAAIEDEIEKYLALGWSETPADAVSAYEPSKSPERLELEAQARQLGVGFNVKTSDETLQQRIIRETYRSN